MSEKKDCKVNDVVVLCGREFLEGEIGRLKSELDEAVGLLRPFANAWRESEGWDIRKASAPDYCAAASFLATHDAAQAQESKYFIAPSDCRADGQCADTVFGKRASLKRN